ncbi:hypothetical protein IGB42_04310 [Andreprevotia sp. IGB-42]|nr:hypothetical protein IGB42_04310 [Andreprevotia sp. IGB-42]
MGLPVAMSTTTEPLAPCVTPLTVSVSPASGSVSLPRTATVTLPSCSTVVLSSLAVGAWLTGGTTAFTPMFTVSAVVPPLPSLTVTVKLSLPVYFASGV